MVECPGVHLRVTPQAIPRLRAAFENAVAMLEPEIDELGQYGYLDGAWLGDPKSAEVAAFYNQRVMTDSDGPYQALVLYKNELIRIVDQLDAMELEYQLVRARPPDALRDGGQRREGPRDVDGGRRACHHPGRPALSDLG